MHLAEGEVQPKTLGTMPGAMYWALTTLTTVGYGDIAPATPLGKLIAGVTMVIGLALFALPVGIIANGFVTGLSRRRFAITWSMLRRLPLFQGFDIDALTDILEAPTAAVIREHAQIVVEGREAVEFFLVVSGTGRMEGGSEDAELGPGSMIGAETLQHHAVYSHTVTAETDMRVISFSGDELRRLCRKYPVLNSRIEATRVQTEVQEISRPVSIDELQAEIARLHKAIAQMTIERLEAQYPA
jgi:voltage-gated potassium channel